MQKRVSDFELKVGRLSPKIVVGAELDSFPTQHTRAVVQVLKLCALFSERFRSTVLGSYFEIFTSKLMFFMHTNKPLGLERLAVWALLVVIGATTSAH